MILPLHLAAEITAAAENLKSRFPEAQSLRETADVTAVMAADHMAIRPI
jgi:hypothetical protein